jgi:ATP-binding cassette subfamily E protein 1
LYLGIVIINDLTFGLCRGMPRPRANEEVEKQTRIAIVNSDKCKPKRCRQECKKSCPVVRMGKLCIEVVSTDKIAKISEELCIGCGICVKVGDGGS